MAWIAQLDLVAAANALVILITGLAVGLGFRRGVKAPTPSGGSSVEVAGALVDSSSIRQLAAALEAQTLEMIAHRMQQKDLATADKDNAKAIERGLMAMTKELEDAKDEIRRLGDAMTRRPP